MLQNLPRINPAINLDDRVVYVTFDCVVYDTIGEYVQVFRVNTLYLTLTKHNHYGIEMMI